MLIEVAMNMARLARPLHTFERRGATRTFDVEGWTVLQDFPTVLFGDGGSIKSLLALYVAGVLARQGTRVLLLDWELDGEDHSERLHRLFGTDVSANLYYLRAEGPLVNEASLIKREVTRLGIQYLICDSVGLTTDGPPEAAEEALKFYRALRRVGVGGALLIADTTKNGDAELRPFGSVYWHHLARMTWFVKPERALDGRLSIRLVNRKSNLTAALSTIRLQFDFGPDRIGVSRLLATNETPEPPDPSTGPSIPQRIAAVIRAAGGQPLTSAAISAALPGTKPETVARILRRTNSFVKVNVAGEARFGLAERRVN